MKLLQIILLAIVQGTTEFLPVSSSGHVVILASLMNLDDEIAGLNVVLHVGTLVSILVFYWYRIFRLLGEDRRTIGPLVVGTIPAVIVGVTLKWVGEDLLDSPLIAGCMLPVTGAILYWASRRQPSTGTYQTISYRDSLLIGLSQAAAILPGISRSGTTISAGLGLGLSRQSAATFSFLLAIPVIAGAAVLTIADQLSGATVTTPISCLIVGATVAFVVGLLSLWWLVRWLEQGRLHYFAWWCFAVGAVTLIWQLWLSTAG